MKPEDHVHIKMIDDIEDLVDTQLMYDTTKSEINAYHDKMYMIEQVLDYVEDEDIRSLFHKDMKQSKEKYDALSIKWDKYTDKLDEIRDRLGASLKNVKLPPSRS